LIKAFFNLPAWNSRRDSEDCSIKFVWPSALLTDSQTSITRWTGWSQKRRAVNCFSRRRWNYNEIWSLEFGANVLHGNVFEMRFHKISTRPVRWAGERAKLKTEEWTMHF
jgi:hypothetical protein